MLDFTKQVHTSTPRVATYFFSNSPVKCLLTNVVLPVPPSPTRTNLKVGISSPVAMFEQLNYLQMEKTLNFWIFRLVERLQGRVVTFITRARAELNWEYSIFGSVVMASHTRPYGKLQALINARFITFYNTFWTKIFRESFTWLKTDPSYLFQVGTFVSSGQIVF